MFGQVERDGLSENLSVQENLVAGKISGTSVNTSVLIGPTLDTTGSDDEYTVVFDSSNRRTGDLLIVFVSVNRGIYSAYLNFPPNLYFTRDGQFTDRLNISVFSEFSMYLQFDGEVFVQTDSNC